MRWRGVEQMGDRFEDLAEVQDATGTAGAFTYNRTSGASALEALAAADVGASSTWGSGSSGTAYVDRERVWLDGFASTVGGSTAVGTLPAGKRPAATVYLPVAFVNDIGGTPASVAGYLTVDTAGVVTLVSFPAPSGDLSIFLGGLSFMVAP